MSTAPRTSTQARTSAETDIRLELTLDGQGKTDIRTGFGLLDHMLTLTAFWAGMDLTLICEGDMEVDAHHTAEDVGLTLGKSLLEALGDRAGIARVGYGRVPMDEALTEVTVDLSGRPWLEWRGDDLLPPVLAGEEKDLWREYYKALASGARCNALRQEWPPPAGIRRQGSGPCTGSGGAAARHNHPQHQGRS